MRVLRSIVLVISCTVIGALVTFVFSLANLNGLFEKWEPLPSLSEPVSNILDVDHVMTDSGQIYKLEWYSENLNGNWLAIESFYPNTEYSLPLETCNWVPDVSQYKDSYVVCEQWGIGTMMRVLAIDDDGYLYRWMHQIGEGTDIMHFLSPILGAVLGIGIGTLLVVFGKDSE